MSLIRTVHTRVVTLDNPSLATSYGPGLTRRDHLFVAIESEEGTTGVAEGSPLPHFSGEYASEMKRLVDEILAPALIGHNVFNLEVIGQALNNAIARHSASKSALVNAIYDLQGNLLDAPVSRLLGGSLTQRIPLAGAIGIEDEATVVARARQLFGDGVRTFKFKVGADVRRDLAALAAVRAEFGNAVELRADANGGYTLAEARRFLAGAEKIALQYFEQPLPGHDLTGLARLRASTLVPIAVDESLYGLQDAIQIIKQEAADVFIIKLIKLGGLYGARKVAAIAEAAGVACVCVSPYETDLGGSANVHLAASSSAFPYAAELGTGVSQVRLEGMTGLSTTDGFVAVPVRAGLGIDLPDGFFTNA